MGHQITSEGGGNLGPAAPSGITSESAGNLAPAAPGVVVPEWSAGAEPTRAMWSGGLVATPVANQTFTVGGVVYTWKAAAAAAYEVTISADMPTARDNLALEILGLGRAPAHPLVTAQGSALGSMALLARYTGAEGNLITVEASNLTPWGGAIDPTLSGGTGLDAPPALTAVSGGNLGPAAPGAVAAEGGADLAPAAPSAITPGSIY